jgi:hypothetical protein
MRVACLTKRWDQHTESRGYDRLASAIGVAYFSLLSSCCFISFADYAGWPEA